MTPRPSRTPGIRPLTHGSSVPWWWPARLYYGWGIVAALGVTATASYGVLSYAFAVFIAPMSAQLGWSKAQITGAFSLGMLVAGGAAIPVGHWVDRHGTRGLMSAGAMLATALLVAWSSVRSLAAFYAIWAGLGVAMAAVLYEPAFATLATWFRARRSRALTVLTFLGGFASVVFVPLATTLVQRYGWRAALVWLAAIYAAVAIPSHALVLRRRPADLGLLADGEGSLSVEDDARLGVREVEPSVEASVALRSASFRWLAITFALASLASTAVSVHLVPLLIERGHGAAFAGAAMGILGLMALPGRLVFTPLGGRWPRAAVTASIFALAALACVALLGSRSTAAVWLFVALFGAGFGAITPARAALLAEMYGPAEYGRISGTLAFVTSIARAAAPIGASLVYSLGAAPFGTQHGYDTVLVVLFVMSIGSGAAVLAAGAAPSSIVHTPAGDRARTVCRAAPSTRTIA